MVRRRARRRTALVVGGAAYAAGRHRAHVQDQEYAEQGYQDQGYEQPPQQAPPPPPAAPAQAFDYSELQRLGELHANGTLTDEEFAEAKAKILGN
jgi:hypothetical protein